VGELSGREDGRTWRAQGEGVDGYVRGFAFGFEGAFGGYRRETPGDVVAFSGEC
jgi:hypothetical protein